MAIVKQFIFLLVDDHSPMRRLMGSLIRQVGYTHVVEAEDGIQAKNRLVKEDIEFIVSDWNMPNMNGLELLKYVRSTPAFQNLPFLMVTAEGSKENIVQAIEAGADGYVVKPFTQAVLSDKLNLILKKRKLI